MKLFFFYFEVLKVRFVVFFPKEWGGVWFFTHFRVLTYSAELQLKVFRV